MKVELQLGKATGIVFETTPYLVQRALVYGALCGVVALGLLFLAVVGWAFGAAAAVVLFVICAAAGGFALRLLREYVLYMLQAGHIAVITQLIAKGALPEGTSQTAWAKQRVSHYFKEISVLALVHQLVLGVINALNRTLFNVMTALPIPSMEGLARIAQRIVHFSLTYIDESIIAYTFKTENENVYDAAKSGIIVYCQSWKALLSNAVALTVLSYLFIVVSTIVFLIPLGVIAVLLPSSWGVAKFCLFALALFMAFSLKWILFDPIACTSTVLTFLREAEIQTPDPTWESRIDAVSDMFGQLKQKAMEKYDELGRSKKDSEPMTSGPSPSDVATKT